MNVRFPPVFKVLLRGNLVMAFILLIYMTGLIGGAGAAIFAVTVVSISMMFGVGYLLMNPGKPVRKANCDIPNTVLVYVKGALILYFVSLLGNFQLLPLEITGLLMTGVAFVLVIFGMASFVLEVFERATPVAPKTERQKEIAAMRRRRSLARRYN